MEMITCNHCSKTKNESEFNWRWKNLGVRQRTCRECQKIQKNEWYAKNKTVHKKNMLKKKQEATLAGRQYVQNYLKTHPCVDCGKSDPAVLEFDHVKGVKRHTISKMVRHGYGINSIQREIAKCKVRCANCHRKKHKEAGWPKER